MFDEARGVPKTTLPQLIILNKILDYEVINRLVEMSTQGKGINSYMSQSIQKLKQDLKECKREQQNSKWREKIELLLEKLINIL